MSPEKDIREIAEKIYRDHYPVLLERAVKMCGGNMDLAKDCVMDIFRAFIENEWRIEEKNRLNYFLVAVTRLCIDRLVSERKREKRGKAYHEDKEFIYDPAYIPPYWQDSTLLLKVRHFLFSENPLSQIEREILRLSFDGDAPRHVSKNLNITPKQAAEI